MGSDECLTIMRPRNPETTRFLLDTQQNSFFHLAEGVWMVQTLTFHFLGESYISGFLKKKKTRIKCTGYTEQDWMD